MSPSLRFLSVFGVKMCGSMFPFPFFFFSFLEILKISSLAAKKQKKAMWSSLLLALMGQVSLAQIAASCHKPAM